MAGDGSILQVDPVLAAPMTIRLVPQGDRFTLERGADCDPDDLTVEFYDRRYAHEPGFTPYGQFIRRFCVSALLAGQKTRLILNDDVPQWALDAGTMARVTEWLRTSCATQEKAA